MPFKDVDGSLEGTKFQEWNNRQVNACAKLGMDTEVPAYYKQWFIDQGFEQVTELKYKWPVGTWAKDRKAKYIGKMVLMSQYFPFHPLPRHYDGYCGTLKRYMGRTLTLGRHARWHRSFHAKAMDSSPRDFVRRDFGDLSRGQEGFTKSQDSCILAGVR